MSESISHINNAGYVLIKEPNHPLSDKRGYIYKHRLVASNIYGVEVVRNAVIHHIDGNRLNNSPKNLYLFSSHSEHMFNHRSENSTRRAFNETNPIIKCACGCGNEMTKYSKHKDRRYFIHGHSVRKYFGCKVKRCKSKHHRQGFCKEHRSLILSGGF